MATVEYKHKKNTNTNNSSSGYGNVIEVPSYQSNGISGGTHQSMMMPATGGLGFNNNFGGGGQGGNNNGDRGDEINLDEL